MKRTRNKTARVDDKVALPGLEAEEEFPRSEDIEAVWECFIATFDPPRKTLSPSRRRLIVKALKETEDRTLCMRAVVGLREWRKRRPGATTISALFSTRPDGPGLGDQIDFFAQQASPETATIIPSATDERITRRKLVVTEMYAQPHVESARERGEEALSWLLEHAREVPLIEDGQLVGWEKVG